MLPPDRVRQLAKETGMVRRERKVDAVAMLWVLLLGFGVRLQRTLASLKHGYEIFTRTTLRDSSWYERFTPEFVTFLRAYVALAIENLAAEVKRERAERLRRFKDLLIQDSTVVRLHEKLAKRWPATRARRVAATYAVRWDIELVFKELKSRCALDVVTSTNPHVVEALIWTAVLTLVVNRRMYNVIRAMAPEEQRARHTPLRWSIIFAENADRLRSVMLKYLGLARDEQEELELLMEIHMGHGLDPHVNQRRLGDRVWA
jgi:hypothetical protein